MQGLSILGTGSYVPDTVVTNDDFTSFLETSDEWIVTRTGMKERRIARDEPTWHMGAQAAKLALETAGLAAADIDMVIGTTVSSDYAFPSMASCVQRALGMPPAIAVDINMACTGIAFALDMARRYLSTGDVKRILIVSAESLSQLTDYTDRSTCILFGDGAGALVVEAADRLFASFQNCDASGGKHVYSRYERRTHPFSEFTSTPLYDFEEEKYGSSYMNGREVYKFATRAMPEAVQKACAKAGLSPLALDLLIVHQANLRIIETAAKNLGVPMERIHVNIHKYGNSSSATMAIALDECVREGKLRRGDKVCFVGFGAGLSYGASVLEY